MKTVVSTAIFLSSFWLGLNEIAVLGKNPAPMGNNVEMIQSSDASKRVIAKNRIIADRKELIKQLIEIVNSSVDTRRRWLPSGSSRNIAISLLGKMRAVEAIPALLLQIVPPKDEGIIITHGGLRLTPGSRALVEIGKPAVSTLLELLAEDVERESQSPLALNNQIVIMLVDIEGLDGAVFLLQKAVALENDQGKRENIERALTKVRTWKAMQKKWK